MSNRTRNLHAWTTRNDEGEKREVRAQLFGSKWTLTSRGPEDEDWVPHEPPALEDLEKLYEVLFHKYQRKRIAWEHVASVEKLIEERTRRP